jgi:hypothetical protein
VIKEISSIGLGGHAVMKTLGIAAYVAIALFSSAMLTSSANASDSGGESRAVFEQSKIKANPIDTEEYLHEFHKNPKAVMDTPLAKVDDQGRLVSRGPSAFDNLNSEEIFQAKAEVRRKICLSSGRLCGPKSPGVSLRAGMDDANQVTKFFFDTNFISTPAEMETKNLLQGQSPRAPWSDSFWPVQKGIIARRWLDAGFPDSRTFIDNYNYYLSNPPGTIGVNSLSPAEKYYLLVGDYSFRLTSANWNEGKSTWDQKGSVPGWAGICHGWSPAAIMTPAPKRSVTLPSVNGTMITFYPSDIKALSSAAFAEAPPKTYFVGTRCQKSHPPEDSMGRVIDPGCFDVNPGTWHIAVVNEMGVNKRSFVLDSQYDYQIWNYPLYSYKYTYFNPQTLVSSPNFAGSAIKMSDFTIDKFKTYRSAAAKFVVGIAMEISYSVETAPSTKPLQMPKLTTMKILYDLELDANGKIIGGEWYSNFHPDFVWHFEPTAKPVSVGEQDMGDLPVWDGQSALSPNLQKAALSSSVNMQPLATVIDTLVRLSQEPESRP